MRCWLICLAWLVSLAVAPAVAAQDKPAAMPNRLLCSSIRALENAIKVLPNANAIRDAKAIPDAAGAPDKKTGAPGCVWVGGKFPIPQKDPVGWLYSGDYLFLVTGIELNTGQKFVHPITVVSSREWRLEDDCAAIDFFTKATLPTNETYRFFGFRRKIGFDPLCRNLVNRVQEANELNAPRKDYSEVWKSRPFRRTNVGCMEIDDLANALDRVVNEQQVNNSDAATFNTKNGCLRRPVDEIVASRFMGLYKTPPLTPRSPIFYTEVHQVIYINKRNGVLTRLFMPTNARRNKMARTEGRCGLLVSAPESSVRNVMLMGAAIAGAGPVTISTPNGPRKIERLSNTPVGYPECETEDLILRR